MGWPIYTERFLQVYEGGLWFKWSVPGGHRAVIKSIDCVSTTTSGGQVIVHVGAAEVSIVSLPGAVGAVHEPATIAVYAGEDISVILSSSALRCAITGYLFRDAAARRGPAGVQEPNPDLPVPPAFVSEE